MKFVNIRDKIPTQDIRDLVLSTGEFKFIGSFIKYDAINGHIAFHISEDEMDVIDTADIDPELTRLYWLDESDCECMLKKRMKYKQPNK
jgi:hypothetical protein